MPPSSFNDLFAFLTQLMTEHAGLFESMGNRRKQRRQSGDRRSDEHDRATNVPEHDRKRCPRAAGERVTENREHGGTGRQDGAEGNQEEEKPGALRHAASIGIR